MRSRVAALLMLVLSTQAACTSSFAIPLREVRNLETGTVKTVRGETEQVRSEYTLEPLPREGYVFVSPGPDGRILEPYPETDPIAQKAPPVEPLRSPVVLTVDGWLVVLKSRNRQVALWPESVSGVWLEQYSPGKTAAVTVVLSLVGALAITAVSGLVWLSSGTWGIAGR